MDKITASEAAGLGVGAVLLFATIAATKVDAFFSSSHRRCKGTGSVREGGILGLTLVQDLYQTLGNSESKVKQIACVKCQAKGYFSCPNCPQL